MDVRLIIQSNESGSKEFVIFTEDFDTPVDDFVYPDCTVDYDEVIECDLPMSFPLDRSLKKHDGLFDK